MKRVILFVVVMISMFVSKDELLAQRGNDRGKTGYTKVKSRNDGRRDLRKNESLNNRGRNGFIDREGRRVVEVNRVVFRSNGLRYSDRVNSWSRYDDFDYDFRNGRRFNVRRGVSPSARHIWVNGYWEYDRRVRREVWVGGHWTIRRDFHRFQNAHYAFIDGSRVWVPGCWVRIS